jgi:phage replication O-like protein O
LTTPQVEDGYTRIANALLEVLAAARLSGRELSVALAVVRLTYGYQKKSDRISASQLASVTGIDRRKIPALLASLESKSILLIKRRGSGKIPTLQIDKRTDRWLRRDATCPVQGAPEAAPYKGHVDDKPAPYKGQEPAPYEGHTKERKKKKRREEASSLDRPDLSDEQIDAMIDRYPGGVKYTREQVRAWIAHVWPDLLDYEHPKTGKRYERPASALRQWWRRVRRDDIEAAMQAARARLVASRTEQPVPEIEADDLARFMRGMEW